MYMYMYIITYILYISSGVETASHAEHRLINLVNVREIKTKLYT